MQIDRWGVGRGARSLMSVVLMACGIVVGCGDDDESGAGPACAGKDGVAGTRSVTIESGGLSRTLIVSVPESALTGDPAPLVLLYHGVFADGESILTLTGMEEKAAEEGFIVAAGDGVGQSWNAGLCCDPAAMMEVDDVLFARDMIAAVEAEYCVDTSRVFATGFSNGAAMAFRLVCEASDLFAAFAPVAGSLALVPCHPSAVKPIEIINDVDDPIVPFALGEFSFSEALVWNECGDGRDFEQPASTVICEVAEQCAGSSRTALCGVEELSHQWPGSLTNPEGPFFATDHIWDFFVNSTS